MTARPALARLETAAHPPARIDDLAADWLARREAGLSVDEQAEFSRWLLADSRHARAVEQIETTWRRLRQPRFTGQADEVVRAIDARVQARTRRTRLRVLTGALAATLAAAAAVGVAFLPPLSAPAPRDPVAVSVVPKPERRTLADGSVVELNAGTQLAVQFSAERREVRLERGEAHFTVTKDSRRPFVVLAGAVAVRAVGTEFAVQLAPAAVEVLVTEGRVAVERPGAAPAAMSGNGGQAPRVDSAPAVTYMDAGTRLTVSATAPPSALLQPRAVTVEDARAALAWRGMRFEFTDTPLADIVVLFNRQNRVQFALGSADLGSIRISGVFWADDPEGFSRLIETCAGLHADRSTASRIMLRR